MSSQIAQLDDSLSKIIAGFKGEYERRMLHYSPTEKGRIFHELTTKAPLVAILGANGSGKTVPTCAQMAMSLTGAYRDDIVMRRFDHPIKAMVVSVTLQASLDTVQRLLFDGVPSDTGQDSPPLINSELVISRGTPGKSPALIRHSSGGVSTLRIGTQNQGVQAFQGPTYNLIHVDEACSLGMLTEFMTRIARAGSHNPLLMCSFATQETTPVDVMAYFDDNADDCEVRNKRVYVKLDINDNPFLSDEKKAELEALIPEHEKAARLRGEFIYGRSKVFRFFEEEYIFDPNTDKYNELFSNRSKFKYIAGLDPAATSGGTWGAVLVMVDKYDGTIYVVDEYKALDKTPTEHARAIRAMVPSFCNIMTDPCGAGENAHAKESNLVYIQKSMGLRIVHARKGNAIKEASIDYLNELFYSSKIKISKKCIQLLKELPMYSRNTRGEIIKKNDHLIDALFYLLMGISNHAVDAAVNGRGLSMREQLSNQCQI